VEYAYDEDNRLISAGTASFEYDEADNLTAAPGGSLSYDGASQLESGAGVSYTYDDLGERTKAEPVTGTSTAYGYDQAGRLTSVERAASGETPAIEEQFEYDGHGRLVSRSVSGETTHLTWDASTNPTALLGDGQNSYIYGPDGEPVESVSGSEVPTFYHHDQLGSTRMLTNAVGEVTATFTYGPYGELEGSTGSATTSLGYAGQYTDGETGFQYLRARYYDPATGQFISRDPAIKASGIAYGYATGNPVNAIDPSGLISVSGVLGTVGEILEPLNPIKYYEEEVEAWENGCSYWDSIAHGLEGALVGASDATGIGGLARGIAGVIARDAAEAGIAGFTSHGLEQVLARDGVGVADEALVDAVRTPVEVIQQADGTVMYVGADARVVLNENREVVTAWATNKSGWRVQP
jgi:RHS repeat-associated protein